MHIPIPRNNIRLLHSRTHSQFSLAIYLSAYRHRQSSTWQIKKRSHFLHCYCWAERHLQSKHLRPLPGGEALPWSLRKYSLCCFCFRLDFLRETLRKDRDRWLYYYHYTYTLFYRNQVCKKLDPPSPEIFFIGQKYWKIVFESNAKNAKIKKLLKTFSPLKGEILRNWRAYPILSFS